MAHEATRDASRLTEQHLELAGFDAEAITRLKALRRQYHPLIEFVDSSEQLDRLRFLRWLYQQGAFQSDTRVERRPV